MTGTNSEVFAASQLVNSVNKQIDGGKGYQVFYDTWPKLSKKKKRKMAYAAVLQSTAKMANALSSCSQANSQFIDTIKKQENIIKAYECKTQACDIRNFQQNTNGLQQNAVNLDQERTAFDINLSKLSHQCKFCGKHFSTTDAMSTSNPASIDVEQLKCHKAALEKENSVLKSEIPKYKQQLAFVNSDLELEQAHTQKLQQRLEEQQQEYVALQNQRIKSNREQLKVIEYLQNEQQKIDAQLVAYKEDAEAIHAEKQNLLHYMSQKLNIAHENSDRWQTLQNSCDETIRTVSDIPHIVSAVQEDIKKLQTQIEIQKQKSEMSNCDPPTTCMSYLSSHFADSSNRSCNNRKPSNLRKCVFSASNNWSTFSNLNGTDAYQCNPLSNLFSKSTLNCNASVSCANNVIDRFKSGPITDIKSRSFISGSEIRSLSLTSYTNEIEDIVYPMKYSNIYKRNKVSTNFPRTYLSDPKVNESQTKLTFKDGALKMDEFD